MLNMETQEASASSSEYSDEEVGVVARGHKLWVRGVRAHTTCADIVRALQDTPEASGGLSERGEWVLAERWRGVERPLPPRAPVLGVLAAWGDARHEVRLSLRRVTSGEDDSGRDSDGGSRRRKSPPPDPAAKLVSVIQHQSRTIHQQLDKLREQEKLIDHLEDQTHKTRMEKHGTNYLLESYLRDLGRAQDINDSQAGNSDSGVGGGSGTPPRRHTKHKSRRERHLMREHYFTKELTNICQVNSERLTQTQTDTDSEASQDELTKIKEEIELLEKLAIINKRLHREEELVVRLTAKVKRYMDENKANSCENASQVTMLIDKLEAELAKSAKEMEITAVELEQTDRDIELGMKLMDDLTLELEEEEFQNTILERQLNEASNRQPILLQENYVPVLEQNCQGLSNIATVPVLKQNCQVLSNFATNYVPVLEQNVQGLNNIAKKYVPVLEQNCPGVNTAKNYVPVLEQTCQSTSTIAKNYVPVMEQNCQGLSNITSNSGFSGYVLDTLV